MIVLWSVVTIVTVTGADSIYGVHIRARAHAGPGRLAQDHVWIRVFSELCGLPLTLPPALDLPQIVAAPQVHHPW